MNCGCGARAIRIDGRYVCSSCRRDPVSCLCPATPVKADMRNDFRMASGMSFLGDYREYLGKNVRILLVGGGVRYGILERPRGGAIPSRKICIRLRTGGFQRLRVKSVALMEVV